MKLYAAVVAFWMALPAAAWAADPAPCQLVTPAEVASNLGTSPAAGMRSGPDVDEKLRAKVWGCDQPIGKAMLSISVVEFPSAAAAAQGLALTLKFSKETPEAMQPAPASGVGDQAAWGASPDGAMWVALKGKYMLNMTLSGGADPQRLKEPLRRLTALALGRL